MLRNDIPAFNPISAAWNTVARFDDYEAAQRAVDGLSDNGFPVEKLTILGSDLRLIERVTGRLTRMRAAGAGAARGLWAGLLIGIDRAPVARRGRGGRHSRRAGRSGLRLRCPRGDPRSA